MIDALLSKKLLTLAELVIAENKQHNLMVATAESCTGGLVSAALTEIAGSSAVLDCGFVTYSYESKSKMLDIPLEYIQEYSAVSIEVVEAMALGAIQNSRADIAVSISGVAGPAGGSVEKPVGTVAFALAAKNGLIRSKMKQFGSDQTRAEIRLQSALFALQWLRPQTV